MLDAGAGLRSCLRSAARSALGSANREGVTCPPAVRPSVATGSRVRQQITDIYEDLARHASFSGILFHDDAVLTDFEDVSPEAVAARRQTGMAHDAAPVPQRPQEREHGCVSKPNPDPLHSGSTPGSAGHPRPAGENGA